MSLTIFSFCSGKYDIIIGLLEALKAMEMFVVLFAWVRNSKTKFRLPVLFN